MNTQRTNEQIAQTLTQYLMGGSCYAEVTTEETKALILAALNEATAERDREIERLRDALEFLMIGYAGHYEGEPDTNCYIQAKEALRRNGGGE